MGRSLRIAIADDEAVLLSYLRKILTGLGHLIVSEARTGKELVEQCRVLVPDLVVSDITMPDLDGCDAAHSINREQRTPFIFVSARLDLDTIGSTEEGECAESDYVVARLAKPIKAVELEAVINRFLRSLDQESDSPSEPRRDIEDQGRET